jgi:hypothetical protein
VCVLPLFWFCWHEVTYFLHFRGCS